jgi:hypothetical protein
VPQLSRNPTAPPPCPLPPNRLPLARREVQSLMCSVLDLQPLPPRTPPAFPVRNLLSTLWKPATHSRAMRPFYSWHRDGASNCPAQPSGPPPAAGSPSACCSLRALASLKSPPLSASPPINPSRLSPHRDVTSRTWQFSTLIGLPTVAFAQSSFITTSSSSTATLVNNKLICATTLLPASAKATSSRW